MSSALATVAAALVAVVAYLVFDLLQKRKELDGLPQPPMPNRLLGHLPIGGVCQSTFPTDVHPHTFIDYIRRKYDMPEVFYVDWRPFGPKWLYCADPELTSQFITTGQSLPKARIVGDFLNQFLGANNMVMLERDRWKNLRSIFNPGFSATNVLSFTDYILDASLVFIDILREKARLNEYFQLERYVTMLTIDIIGKVALDSDFNSQKKVHPIVQAFRERVTFMPPAQSVFPWQGVSLLRPYRLWKNNRELEAAIGIELDRKVEARAASAIGSTRGKKQRSVVDLALDAYEKEVMATESQTNAKGSNIRIRSPSDMPSSLRQDIIDQIKTFIFAGHDTTSSTICYVLYLLHLHPKAYAKLKAELDTHFPPDVNGTVEKIRTDPYITNKLEYTNAVIRETLRLFPPASTIRDWDPKYPGKDHAIVDPKTGQRYPLEGTSMWPASHLIHRNERFFPEPRKFVPDRHIQSQTPYSQCELFTPAGKDAWRPFEKGPRNCIGQELAMVESRIIIALLAREFDFVVEFPGEEADVRFFKEGEDPQSNLEERQEGKRVGDRLEGYRMYQTLMGAAKPTGGCPGRVKLRGC